MQHGATTATRWIVRLGEPEWSRHTHAKHEGLSLLGSVRRGAQVGALAQTVQGDYVQVVGDFIAPLNRAQLSRAVAAATAMGTYGEMRPVQRPAPAPVVSVKRRRVPVIG